MAFSSRAGVNIFKYRLSSWIPALLDAFVLMKMIFKHIKEFCQEKLSILFPFKKVHCVKLP